MTDTNSTTESMQAMVLTEEQASLRDITRSFLKDRVPSSKVRDLMATPTAFDDDLWQETAALGWPAMTIPEQFGGAGYGMVELAVVFEEMGRAVMPIPMLSTSMASATLLSHGTDAQRDTWLPAIAAGTARVTVAVPVRGAGDGVEMIRDGADRWLTGHAGHVLDADGADAVIVGTDHGVVLVPFDRDGITVTGLDVLDPTRPLARVDFDTVGIGDTDLLAQDVDLVLDRARTVGAVLLANELVGVAAAAHAMAVAHAKQRTQFGRAIGSFQAIKHLLADDLVQLEAARSAAWWAARALAVGDEQEVAVAVPVAAALCPPTAATITGHAIQVHGGIGFTWEHDAHLYYKRAAAALPLLGHADAWRRRLGTALGIC